MKTRHNNKENTKKSLHGKATGGRELTFEDCIYALDKKRDIKIDLMEKTITKLSNKNEKGERNTEKINDIGNKSLGRLDYLVKKCGFHIIYVNKFNFKRHENSNIDKKV